MGNNTTTPIFSAFTFSIYNFNHGEIALLEGRKAAGSHGYFTGESVISESEMGNNLIDYDRCGK